MKCKVCGHRTNSLPAMSKHYRKKHPGKMKPKKTKTSGGSSRRGSASKEELRAALLELLLG